MHCVYWLFIAAMYMYIFTRVPDCIVFIGVLLVAFGGSFGRKCSFVHVEYDSDLFSGRFRVGNSNDNSTKNVSLLCPNSTDRGPRMFLNVSR